MTLVVKPFRSFASSKLKLIVFLTLRAVYSSFLTAQDLATVIEESERSVVRIEVSGAKGDSLGSGFVISNDGRLCTNVHVLAGAEKARAIFPDGKTYDIVGTYHIDPSRDICIAKMKATKTIPIKLAASLPRKGETVTALGAPMGLSFTATNGIVSAIRKDFGRETNDETTKGTWIQVDAALSPGNSGGPLINKKGEVVAMSTRASSGGRAQNLNFGISIDDIKAAISKSENASMLSIANGIRKVKMHDIGGGESDPDAIIQRKTIPESAIKAYVDLGREDFRDLARNVRREATSADKLLKTMKKGQIGFPFGVSGGDVIIRQVGQVERYHFRSESFERRIIKKEDEKVSRLKKIKDRLADSSDEVELLKYAGPPLDIQDKNSVGFMEGAIVIHAFNEHDIIVAYDETPVLMWVESSTGLAMGSELSPTPAYVVGTQTARIPGKSTMSVTLIQAVTEKELDEVAAFSTWRTKSGKHSVEAKLVEVIGDTIKLEKKDGSTVSIDLSILDEESQNRAKPKK